jgi:hypothetical protein
MSDADIRAARERLETALFYHTVAEKNCEMSAAELAELDHKFELYGVVNYAKNS